MPSIKKNVKSHKDKNFSYFCTFLLNRDFWRDKVFVKTTRKRQSSIRPVEEIAPWLLISQAAKESGLTGLLIRNSGITRRPFGNADYIRPADLNAWINGDGGKEETQP